MTNKLFNASASDRHLIFPSYKVDQTDYGKESV